MMQANGSSSSELQKAADYILLHTGLDKTARFQGAVAEAVAKTFNVSFLGNNLPQQSYSDPQSHSAALSVSRT